MLDIVKVLVALASGYLLGSVNMAVIVGAVCGKDIRAHGSRSAGLTNALRVLGRPAAALVLVADVLKGVLACLVGLYLGVHAGADGQTVDVTLLAAGAGAVIGHNWPVYFGFRGGKGALTAAAVMFMVDWVMSLVSLAVFVAVVALTRYVSLGTLCAIAAFLALSFLPAFASTLHIQLFSLAMAAVIVFRHRENVKRLLSGTESRIAF